MKRRHGHRPVRSRREREQERLAEYGRSYVAGYHAGTLQGRQLALLAVSRALSGMLDEAIKEEKLRNAAVPTPGGSTAPAPATETPPPAPPQATGTAPAAPPKPRTDPWRDSQ